jgi:hypothetical protein
MKNDMAATMATLLPREFYGDRKLKPSDKKLDL